MKENRAATVPGSGSKVPGTTSGVDEKRKLNLLKASREDDYSKTLLCCN